VLPRQQYERDQSTCLRRARCFLFHRLTLLIDITGNLEDASVRRLSPGCIYLSQGLL
jgi:hypothetical protein